MKTLTQRKIADRLKKELEHIELQKKQREVASLTIIIEWKKSYTWGMNPNASVEVEYKHADFTKGEAKFERSDGYRCSGCGYDKESTVIADIFNRYLRYKLYQKRELKSTINGEEVNHPYGVYYYNGDIGEKCANGYIDKPMYNDGVGTSCYYDIAKFIGGRFENVANGKTFSVFKYTDGAPVKRYDSAEKDDGERCDRLRF